METASDNFSLAASGSAVVWCKPLLMADWAGDGFDTSGGYGTGRYGWGPYGGGVGELAPSLDDLSGALGTGWTVTHALDDGLPTDVHSQTVDPIGQFNGPLSGAPDYATVVDWTPNAQPSATQYFSPFNTASPLYGLDRDVARMVLQHGLVTATGPERVTIYRGVMADLPVTARTATIQGTSLANRLMQTLVQPPAINGATEGLTGSWPVSYALYQSNLYVSPPARPGARLWMPMHGSLHPMVPDGNYTTPVYSVTVAGTTIPTRPQFRAGPFVCGLDAAVNTNTQINASCTNLPLARGMGLADLLTRSGNAGRVEFWICGVDADISVANPARRIFGLNTFVVKLLASPDGGATPAGTVTVGLDSGRHVFVTVDDGAGHLQTLTSVNTVPIDGDWHHCGAAYDIAGKKLWVKVDSTVATLAVPAFVTTSLLTSEQWASNTPLLYTWLPVAELMLTSGAQANPDNYRWTDDPLYWDPQNGAGAIVRPSVNTTLAALVETAPQRAIDLISKVAQAELAMTRCDEDDVFLFLPMSYWVESAQQTQVDTLTAEADIADYNIINDYTRVRNAASLAYNETTVEMTNSQVYASTAARTIPPGQTILTVALDKPAVSVSLTIANLQPAAFPTPPTTSWVTLCSTADGTGAYATAAQISVAITSWTPGSATLLINNTLGAPYFLANNGSIGALVIQGRAAIITPGSVAAEDDASIAARGERGMTVTLPGIQDRVFAQAIANELVSRHARPRGRLEGLRVFGDPRRQPGDLVAVTDRHGTHISGLWRLMSVSHSMQGATYEQTVTAIQAWVTGKWDTATWGNTIWSA